MLSLGSFGIGEGVNLHLHTSREGRSCQEGKTHSVCVVCSLARCLISQKLLLARCLLLSGAAEADDHSSSFGTVVADSCSYSDSSVGAIYVVVLYLLCDTSLSLFPSASPYFSLSSLSLYLLLSPYPLPVRQ